MCALLCLFFLPKRTPAIYASTLVTNTRAMLLKPRVLFVLKNMIKIVTKSITNIIVFKYSFSIYWWQKYRKIQYIPLSINDIQHLINMFWTPTDRIFLSECLMHNHHLIKRKAHLNISESQVLKQLSWLYLRQLSAAPSPAHSCVSRYARWGREDY